MKPHVFLQLELIPAEEGLWAETLTRDRYTQVYELTGIAK